MIEFNTYLPNPRAPTIFVNKIGGLHRLSTTITKLSLALSCGRAVVVASLIWESAELDEAHRLLRWAFDKMRRGRIEAVSGRPSIRAN
jgi:hypothetical protein